MSSQYVKELNSTNFDSTIDHPRPVLVDFWAPWCGPCKAIAPILDQLAEELHTQVQICKVNVDNNSELAAKFNVRAIPTLLIFKDGKVVDQIVGLVNKDDLKKKLIS